MKVKINEHFETLEIVYLTVQRNIPEELNIQQRRCENLKSRIITLLLIVRNIVI
jgi:hypothetical protein